MCGVCVVNVGLCLHTAGVCVLRVGLCAAGVCVLRVGLRAVGVCVLRAACVCGQVLAAGVGILEAHGAEWAAVEAELRVHALVVLESSVVVEAFPAALAGIRFLPGVDQHVHAQARPVHEQLPALLARKRHCAATSGATPTRRCRGRGLEGAMVMLGREGRVSGLVGVWSSRGILGKWRGPLK